MVFTDKRTDTVLKPVRTRQSGSAVLRLALLCVFAGLVLFPIARMLFHITPDGIKAVFTSPTIKEILGGSVAVSATATVIAVTIAYILAYCIERTAIKGKAIFSVILILPMLIPSISHGMGLVLLFGNNGIITNLLGLKSNIYGFRGIVAGSVLYAFPVAFLMLSDVMKYEDSSPYEAAKVLNIPKWRRFTSIALPFMRRPLISVVFAVFTMIITDYGVPLMVGGKFKTLSVTMYQEVIGQVNFDKGCVWGAMLLLPAVVAFIADLMNEDRGNSSFVTRPFEPSRKKSTLTLSYIYTSLVSLFTLLPLISFIILGFTKKYPSDLSFSLQNIEKVLKLRGVDYLANSVIIALATACIGTVLGFVTAYLTARSQSPVSKLLHLISITAMAVPGIVLGLSYVIVYKGSPIYGTLIILIMANLVHFIASPYLMMYNSLNKINPNIESVGATLGIGKLRLIKDVFLPQSFSTLVEMFVYFFVNCMMTISAVSFLANSSTKPISLMINQFEAMTQLENAAIVSLAILIINLLVKGIMTVVRRVVSAR